MAKAKQPPRVRTKEDSSTNVEDEALLTTENESYTETEAETGDAALVAAEAPIPTEVELPIATEARSTDEGTITVEAAGEPLPSSEVEVFASLGHAEPQPTSLPSAASIHAATLNTVFAEVTDYSKNSFENSCVFVKTLLGTKSFEGAIRIQSEYAKTSYVDFVGYLTRLLAIYSKLANEALQRRSHIA